MECHHQGGLGLARAGWPATHPPRHGTKPQSLPAPQWGAQSPESEPTDYTQPRVILGVRKGCTGRKSCRGGLGEEPRACTSSFLF